MLKRNVNAECKYQHYYRTGVLFVFLLTEELTNI